MAKPIIELQREQLKHGRIAVNLLYLYPVNPLISVDGTVVVLTPRNTLPAEVEYFQLLSETELAVIESGAGAFLQERIEQLEGESTLDVLEKAIVCYEKGWDWIEYQRMRYEHMGDRHAASVPR